MSLEQAHSARDGIWREKFYPQKKILRMRMDLFLARTCSPGIYSSYYRSKALFTFQFRQKIRQKALQLKWYNLNYSINS